MRTKKMKVKTGFGYLKDADDNIVGKYDLPKGDHPIQEDMVFVEVASANALKAIRVHGEKTEDETIAESVREQKINDEIRAIAIERLQARGEL